MNEETTGKRKSGRPRKGIGGPSENRPTEMDGSTHKEQIEIEVRWQDKIDTGRMDRNTTEEQLIAGMRIHFRISPNAKLTLSHWVSRDGG
jgi:hypothetical protein